MATATMTAAGAAALLYYTLNKKLHTRAIASEVDESTSESESNTRIGLDRISNRLIQAPGTWLETISALSETLRFTYSETLGKWPIGELAFGINFLLKSQGKLHIETVFGGKDCLQLKGTDMIIELRDLLNLLTICWHFSKKPFPLFLEETGYSEQNVLLHEPKAGILKPAFTILVDHKLKTFLLVIRGTHSIKDTLTAVTGAVVPFHHSVVHEGGVSKLVLGYAHCGMVAAARWIAKLSIPCLLKAIEEFPNYALKIVGHSLGGGTAALLVYVLREKKEFSNATCVTFAPAACMTWELAESGNGFITSVINGADLVPTFSAASVDDLRAEVTASAWLNDLRDQMERNRIVSTVFRSASALGSRLPSMANARAKVAGAGAILRPVSNGTQVVVKRAHSMAQAAWSRPRPSLRLSSWSCVGPRRRVKVDSDDVTVSSSIEGETSKPFIEASVVTTTTSATFESTELPISSSSSVPDKINLQGVGGESDDDDDEIDAMEHHGQEERMTEVELWQKLEQELYNNETDSEEADVVKEIREEEEEAAAAAIAEGETEINNTSLQNEVHRFFPPGKIMHIVPLLIMDEIDGQDPSYSDESEHSETSETKVGIFLTPRSLYSKLRLSESMISDHLMPVYRRQIEKLIVQLKEEDSD